MKSPGSLPKLKRPKLIVRQVAGTSMLPTLKPGRIVIATGTYSRIRIGDIVVIRHGGLEKIKRVQDLRADRVFLLGDNPENSTDSRAFGWLPTSVMVAKVIWPVRYITKHSTPYNDDSHV